MLSVEGIHKDEYNGRYFYNLRPIGECEYHWMIPSFQIPCSVFVSQSVSRVYDVGACAPAAAPEIRAAWLRHAAHRARNPNRPSFAPLRQVSRVFGPWIGQNVRVSKARFARGDAWTARASAAPGDRRARLTGPSRVISPADAATLEACLKDAMSNHKNIFTLNNIRCDRVIPVRKYSINCCFQRFGTR